MSDPLADPLAPSKTGRNPSSKAAFPPVSDATHPSPRDDQNPSQPSRPTSAVRVSRLQLLKLAAQLPDRDRQILETVDMLRLARTDQLRRLFFQELTTTSAQTRVCRRSLQRLTDYGLLRPIERRIGGDHAGSNGQVYALASAGRRLLTYWAGEGLPSNRGLHEPGLLFARHTLAIGDLYVAVVEADRAGVVELLSFAVEPVRTYTSPIGKPLTLRPDARVRLGVGEYEQISFCELDLGSEGRGALERKLQAYVGLYRSGREQAHLGLFPRVAWIGTTPARAELISGLVAALPADVQKLFATTTTEQALTILAGGDAPRGQRAES